MIRLLACLVCLQFGLVGYAEAKRVALVVGNSGYETKARLSNASRDARAVGNVLKALDFEVLVALDLGHADFAETLLRFEDALQDAEIGAFYFAGHGIQFDGRNYLLPTDATIANPYRFHAETMALDLVIDLMSRSAATSLIFVDACRDNPFVDRLQASLPQSRSGATTRGLARMQSRPDETIVVYATAPNEVAWDGDGQNSPFAKALIEHLPARGVEVGLAMRRVIGSVRDETGGRQSPEVTVALTREVYLSGERGALADAGANQTRPEPRPRKPILEEVDRSLEALWAAGLDLGRQGDNWAYLYRMQEAHDLAVRHFGTESHQYAQAQNHMIGPLSRLGREEDALFASEEAVRVFSALYGRDSTRVANDLANMASRLSSLGRHDEADNAYHEAISIYESARRMGWDHIGYGTVQIAYARFLSDAGDPKRGRELASASLETFEDTGNTRVRHYADALKMTADIERRYFSCNAAQDFYRRAVDAYRIAGVSEKQSDHAFSARQLIFACP